METTLHRQLKHWIAGMTGEIEAVVGNYRVDVRLGNRLVEIQHSGLSALRPKVRGLLRDGFEVDVVKPIAVRTRIGRVRRRGGPVVSRRWSPRRGHALELFEQLVHFIDPFPHPRLRLVALSVEVEESRRRLRRTGRPDQTLDRACVAIVGQTVVQSAADLRTLLPGNLTDTFGTRELAEQMHIPRWMAQKVAYCLRRSGCTEKIPQPGRTPMYRFAATAASGNQGPRI